MGGSIDCCTRYMCALREDEHMSTPKPLESSLVVFMASFIPIHPSRAASLYRCLAMQT